MAQPAGLLSYTGTTNNDIVDVNKGYSPLVPGGYYIEVETREWEAPNFSANCTEGRGTGTGSSGAPRRLVSG